MNALEKLASEAKQLGYQSTAIIRDYEFTDVVSSNSVRRASLAVFSQTPASYRSAAFGATITRQNDAEALVRAHTALGAPLFFVVEGDSLSAWQVYANGPPRLLHRSPVSAIEKLFRAHRKDWSPDAIHRAKSIGRYNREYQLDFVDVGLMSTIEGQIHEKLDRLLQEALATLGRKPTQLDAKALFQGVFRLLAAKILLDRNHSAASNWRGADVRTVLAGIGDYYGLAQTSFGLASVAGKLKDAWSVLSSGLNVSNISADDLAFVYENTLVTPETRISYGTHSTPRHVAEYITGRLELWRDAINPPKIFEPFAGAGVFLVSALRQLREALPRDWSDKERHDLLVRCISGAEIDAFACEVATLSLILADYPNRNGWKIENTDLFNQHHLQSRLAQSDVVLCNPPFEIFTEKERSKYDEIAAISGAKAQAVLALTLKATPRALGFVLPRTFLMDRAYREQRQAIERLYRDVELVSLPDGIFSVSQVETALLIARNPGKPGQRQLIKSSEVDDKDRRHFAFSGAPSRTREDQRHLSAEARGSLWITPLGLLWQRLRGNPKLGDFVDAHWGLRWTESGQRNAVRDHKGADTARGVIDTQNLAQFALGQRRWLDLSPTRNYAGLNYAWSEPKILCNAARLSRRYWRLAAVVDRSGLFASQQFIALWPHEHRKDLDLDVIAAILNGPIANAFMCDYSTEKRFRIATFLDIPFPKSVPTSLGKLVREYTKALQTKQLFADEAQLAQLLDEIDIAILDAYDLPPRLSRDLLSAFTGSDRPVSHQWKPWNVSVNDPALTLSELRSGLLKQAQDQWTKHLKPVSEDEAAKAAPFLS